MSQQTRRQFLAGTAAAGLAGWRALGAQAAQSIPIPSPGFEVGETTAAFALRNVTVIDVAGKQPVSATTVIIAGSRIQSLGPTASTAVPANVQIVDAEGKFLIPGLWDMHAHWWPWPVGVSPLTRGVSPLFIPNGVLAVRTMGGGRTQVQQFVQFREEVRQGKRLGPRLAVAGRTLTNEAVTGPAQGRAAVRDALGDGAEFIKVHDPLSPDTYFAIVDEARKLELTVVGHAPGPELPIDVCANAGQRSFEHMRGVFSYIRRKTGALNLKSLSASQKEILYDVFRKNRSWLCPTLVVMPSFGVDPRTSQDPALKYIDSANKTRWIARADTPAPDPDGPEEQRYEDALGLVGALHRAGVGTLAGTDTRPSATSGVPPLPGFSLHDELRHLVRAGLTPMDALRAATYNPAEFLGLRDSLGTVERGKLAELVLLDANPLDEIANTTKINMVFTGGRVYRRPALNAMLNAVEANARN